MCNLTLDTKAFEAGFRRAKAQVKAFARSLKQLPTSPPRCCPCGGVIRGGKCSRCTPKIRETRSTEDIHLKNVRYGRRWKAFREQYLRANPLCTDCQAENHIAAASEPHHIEKVRDRPDLQYDHDNLMPLCKHHHSIRTANGE